MDRWDYKVDDPQEFTIVFYFKDDAEVKVCTDWMDENVQCKWHFGGFQIDNRKLTLSFSDLETATLFRLRF